MIVGNLRHVEPPEPLEVDTCIEYDDTRVPLMGFAFESQETLGC